MDSRFTVNTGSALRKHLDPDPQNMNADPQPWFFSQHLPLELVTFLNVTGKKMHLLYEVVS